MGTGASSSKRKRVQKNTIKFVKQTLTVQGGIYASEKFSDSLSVSHVLNLLVESEDQYTRPWPHQLTRIPR
jgi:hypothetical protein